jgi:hypothetical protein
LGGQAREAPWETIKSANIDGMVNLYEAARKSSITPRIIFASSNHAIGYYKQTEKLDANSTTRPDGLYGVSANDASLWDNREVSYIGWNPKDNAEDFRAKIEAEIKRPSVDDVNALYHGGGMCGEGIHEG